MLGVAFGVISTILLVADPVLLQDIGNQSEAGMRSAGEWVVVTVSFAVHSTYVVVSLTLVSLTLRARRREAEPPALTKNEVLFASVSYAGVFAGSLGLLFLVFVMIGGLGGQPAVRRVVPVFSLVIAAPYLVMLAVWCIERVLKRSLWDDEKQRWDVHRGSLLAAVVSLPVMVVLYGMQLSRPVAGFVQVAWLPTLVFVYVAVASVRILAAWRRG